MLMKVYQTFDAKLGYQRTVLYPLVVSQNTLKIRQQWRKQGRMHSKVAFAMLLPLIIFNNYSPKWRRIVVDIC